MLVLLWLRRSLNVDRVDFQAGDAVMMLRNNRKLGVSNGNRGTVIDVDPNEQSMRVSVARGQVTLPAAYLQAGNVGHAYAMTINKAHGMTCDRTMTLGNDQLYRELTYEALSRGRLSNQLYVPRSCVLDIEDGPHARTTEPGDPTAPSQTPRPRRDGHDPAHRMVDQRPAHRTSTSPNRRRRGPAAVVTGWSQAAWGVRILLALVVRPTHPVPPRPMENAENAGFATPSRCSFT